MDIQFPQILFQIINFSVVMGALTYLLYKPVLKILQERAEKIEKAQKAAAENLAEKDTLSELRKETLEKAEKEAAKILEEARESAKRIETEADARAKKKIQAEVEKNQSDWKDKEQQHLIEMKKTFIATVMATAEKVINNSLDEKKQKKLLDAGLKELVEAI